MYLDAEVMVLPPVFRLQDSVFVGRRFLRHPTYLGITSPPHYCININLSSINHLYYNPYGRDGLAHSRSLSTARLALRVA